MSAAVRKPAPVRVVRPDPKTGELIEEIRPANSFGVQLPSKPTKPDPDAWRNFWGAHSECLSREERRKIARGLSQASLRPLEFKPAWQKGDVLEVASGLSAEVMSLSWSRDGYVTLFRLVDHRPLLMAQTMGGAGVPWVDENGYPVTYSESVKEAARIDGAYTRSTSQGVADAGEVLDESVLKRLHADTAIGSARKRKRKRVHVDLDRAETRLEEAKAKHWATGHIERQIAKLKARRTKEAA
jgi:hypothetical protein